LALKRYDEADKVLLTATHYNNSNGDYYNALAYVSFARGQDSRAEAALNKSINLNGNQPYALYNMAISKYNDEMYHDALEYFTQSALLYKKDKQDLKVSRVISDIYDMGKFIKKSKITEAIKTINKG
jgi:Flp pilus assembly protein TadD